MKTYLCYILWALLSLNYSLAQIRVNSIKADEWVKKNFSGQGVVIGQVKYSGNPLSFGAFSSTGNVLQLQNGLVLSTGSSKDVAGYNITHNLSKAFGDIDKHGKDDDLSKIVKENFYDVSCIEFDFVPLANSIQFNYQFGSDEYPEFVGSSYNDIFAFFVSDEKSNKNIALIPGRSIPVSINNVNSKNESAFFIDNNIFSEVVVKRQAPVKAPVVYYRKTLPGRVLLGIKEVFKHTPDEEPQQFEIKPDEKLLKKMNPVLYKNLQYDGITKKLTAQMYVEPYKKYHLKIIVADVMDNVYDSGVFIEDHSLTAKRDTLQPGFVDYPELGKLINPQLILQGKKLDELLTPSVVAKQNVVIFFDFDQSTILPSEMIKLQAISKMYGQLKSRYTMKISAHTDSIGSLKYNIALSNKRNQAVLNALKGIIPSSLPVIAIDDAYLKPVATNNTEEGRKANRRVEVTFVKKE